MVGGSRVRPVVAGSGRHLALGVLACLACASPVVLEDGRWRHAALGYSIDAPGPGWEPLRVEQADLAFRGPRAATLSLSSRCRTPLAEPRVLARHLLIGLPGRSPLEGRAVLVDDRPGWLQRYEVRSNGAKRLLTSVTAVVRECVIDFVLVQSDPGAPAAAEFERWWRSFRWTAGREATS